MAKAGVRSYRVATYGSDLSPMWLNMVEDLTVGRVKTHIIVTDFSSRPALDVKTLKEINYPIKG